MRCVTDKVNGYCNQVLRATVDIEVLRGPDYRVTTGPAAGGSSPTPYWGTAGFNTRAILARFPILAVTQVQVSPNTFPRNWTTLPANWAEPEYPPFGIYNSVAPAGDAYGGQAIIIGSGYVNKCLGRNGYILMISYINGWPHAEITANATAGSNSITVSDCTGWGITSYQGIIGATGVIKDAGQQETVHVTAASVASGPGTLTLNSNLVYPHEQGTLLTTLPASIEEACILFGAAEALTRGATSSTIHDIGGHSQFTGGDIVGLNTEAELLCHPFRRTM